MYRLEFWWQLLSSSCDNIVSVPVLLKNHKNKVFQEYIDWTNACGILYVELLKSMVRCPIEPVERKKWKSYSKKKKCQGGQNYKNPHDLTISLRNTTRTVVKYKYLTSANRLHKDRRLPQCSISFPTKMSFSMLLDNCCSVAKNVCSPSIQFCHMTSS